MTSGPSDETGREQTGYDGLRWIEKQAAIAGLTPPKLAVHSGNPPTHERMRRANEAIRHRAE